MVLSKKEAVLLKKLLASEWRMSALAVLMLVGSIIGSVIGSLFVDVLFIPYILGTLTVAIVLVVINVVKVKSQSNGGRGESPKNQ